MNFMSSMYNYLEFQIRQKQNKTYWNITEIYLTEFWQCTKIM